MNKDSSAMNGLPVHTVSFGLMCERSSTGFSTGASSRTAALAPMRCLRPRVPLGLFMQAPALLPLVPPEARGRVRPVAIPPLRSQPLRVGNPQALRTGGLTGDRCPAPCGHRRADLRGAPRAQAPLPTVLHLDEGSSAPSREEWDRMSEDLRSGSPSLPAC